MIWPSHFRAFVERHKLAGAEVEIPESSDLSEIGASIGVFDEAQATDEADNFYPGRVVREDGFLPIGQDLTGGGDPYFINVNDRAPGPLYRIYHDSVADRDYDRDDAVCKILESYELLLEFCLSSHPPNKSLELTREK